MDLTRDERAMVVAGLELLMTVAHNSPTETGAEFEAADDRARSAQSLKTRLLAEIEETELEEAQERILEEIKDRQSHPEDSFEV